MWLIFRLIGGPYQCRLRADCHLPLDGDWLSRYLGAGLGDVWSGWWGDGEGIELFFERWLFEYFSLGDFSE